MVRRTAPRALTQQLEAAQAEHKQGRHAEARRLYRKILKKSPGFIPALHFLGVLEHMDGNSAEGLELVQRAHARAPDDYDIRKNLSNMLNEMGRAEEAEPLCQALVLERPDDPGNHSNHSVALRKLGRFVEAVAAGRQAVGLAPDHAVGWHALANALGGAGALKEAVEAYEKVIAISPGFSPAHNGLCRALLQIEQAGAISRFRLSRTRQAYRRWLQAVPGHPTASFMLQALEKGPAPARMPDAAVKASFDASAADFDKHLRTLEYCAPQLIADLLADRLPGPNGDLDVLDGGCGTGLSAGLLRPYACKLTGVDLSPGMLRKAGSTGYYDVLVEAELGEFLTDHRQSFDVCVFVDVLTYFGELGAILRLAAAALKPGGLLAFTVEKSSRPGSHLNPTGRYSHHPDHVRAALESVGLRSIELRESVIRLEGNAPVQGLIASALQASA